MSILFVLRSVFLLSLAASPAALAESPDAAPRLPAPRGNVVRVTTTAQLHRAVAAAPAGATIMLTKGTYRLSRPIHVRGARNLALRGETGRYEDVVVRGAGMNDKAVYHGILADNVDGLLIADMTIGWVGYHPIALSANSDRVHVRHCRLVDAGEQFVKASSDGKGGGSDDGRVEYCVLEYTDWGPPNGYTNGVDVHGGENWIVRHNLFRNIRTPAGARYKAVPAVLMWNGAKNTVCESNVFINCDRAVAFGLTRRSGFSDHEGGVIRNNFVLSDPDQVRHPDTGIFVASPGTKILHNTVLLNGGYPNAIETRWDLSEKIAVRNNLTDARITARNGSTIVDAGNRTDADPSMFAGVDGGKPRLVRQLPRVKPHADCAEDFNGGKRPADQVTPGALEP